MMVVTMIMIIVVIMIMMIKTGGKRRNIESREAARLRRRRGGSAPGGRLIYLDEERLRKNMIYYSNLNYVIYLDEKRLRIKRIKHAGGNMLMSKKVQYLITGGEGGMERDAWIREEIQPCHMKRYYSLQELQLFYVKVQHFPGYAYLLNILLYQHLSKQD